MEAAFLEVPYAEREHAKALGARWNPDAKKWYVPIGLASARFQRWIPQERGELLQAKAPIYLLESQAPCWKCSRQPTVVTIASRGVKYDKGDTTVDGFVVLSYVERMAPEIEEAVRGRYPLYYLDYSRTTRSRYYMNHCECRARLGDFHLHDERGAPFFMTGPEQPGRIHATKLMDEGTFTFRSSFCRPSSCHIAA